ncbi:MAG: hypothetical protein Q8L26_03575 [Candidatus Omnitrophota bacterium]|nr:hypothetical protein [Candidatus Omnitrophota bacterium]
MNYKLKDLDYKRATCRRGQATPQSIGGQVTLEMALALVALIFFIAGAVRIGVWYNNELVEKEPPFVASRLDAGSNTAPGKWPVYARRQLNEDWVLKGKNFPSPGTYTPGSGTGGGRGDGGGGAADPCPAATALEAQVSQMNIDAAKYDYNAALLDLDAYLLEQQAAVYGAQADYYAAEANNANSEANYWASLYATCMNGCGYCDCSSYSSQRDYWIGQRDYYLNEEVKYRALEQQLLQQALQKRIDAQLERDKGNAIRADATNLLLQAQAERDKCAAQQY